jgi:hypothetical protein
MRDYGTNVVGGVTPGKGGQNVWAYRFSTPQEAVRELGQIDISVLNGSIGSQLENLQRKGGFKGFNQHTASRVIAETDPRKQPGTTGRATLCKV